MTEKGQNQTIQQQIQYLRGVLRGQGESQRSRKVNEKVVEVKQKMKIMEQTNQLKLNEIKESMGAIEKRTIKKLSGDRQINKTQIIVNHELTVNDTLQKYVDSTTMDNEQVQKKLKQYKEKILNLKMKVLQSNEKFQLYGSLVKEQNEQCLSSLNKKMWYKFDETDEKVKHSLQSSWKGMMKSIEEEEKRDEENQQSLEKYLDQFKEEMQNSIENEKRELEKNFDSHYQVLEKTIEVLTNNLS